MRKITYILTFLFALTFNSFALDHWMESQAKDIENLPLNRIFIPGTHDSATYALENTLAKGQDITHKLNALKYIGLGNTVTKIAKKWSVTQNRTVLEQLRGGVRYLDLRIVYRDSMKAFYTVHGLYGPSLHDILDQIHEFTNEHPKEILILQLGDFRYMPGKGKDHQKVFKLFQTRFKGKLIPKIDPETKKSSIHTPLKKFWERGQQILLIYNDDNKDGKNDMAKNNPDLWEQSVINSRWINADNMRDFTTRLNEHLTTYKEDSSQFFFYPVQLSSSPATIKGSISPFNKGYKSLEDMSKPMNVWVEKGLLPQWKGKPGVVVVDFENGALNKAIIEMNVKTPSRKLK